MSDHPRPPVGAPVESVAVRSDQIDVFVCGDAGRIRTSRWRADRSWSEWVRIGHEPFNIPPGSPISAVTPTPDELGVFVCGNDGRAYQVWWNEGNGWAPRWSLVLDPEVRSPPGSRVGAVALPPDRVGLFMSGDDGRLHHLWWARGAGWSERWSRIGPQVAPGSPVAAVARQADHLDLFVTGQDGSIFSSWHNTTNRRWGNWFQVGGGEIRVPPGSPVSVIARSPNHLDLFVVDRDGYVQSIWWNSRSGWADGWFRLAPRRPILGRLFGGGIRRGPKFTVPPGTRVAAVARQAGVIDLFASRRDDRLYWMGWREGEGWANRWKEIGQPRLRLRRGTPVSTLARIPEQVDLFVAGRDGHVYSTWGGANGSWAEWFRVGRPLAVPGNLRVVRQEGLAVDLAWDRVPDAERYELRFDGERVGRSRDHTGTRRATAAEYSFRGWNRYAYRFRVRALSDGLPSSPWSPPTEAYVESAPRENLTLLYDVDLAGMRLFRAVVRRPDPARLTSVRVIGGPGASSRVVFFFTPWDPEERAPVLIDPERQAEVAPGEFLTGRRLAVVYGTSEPALPLNLHAFRRDDPRNRDPIPVEITYRRGA